MKARSLLLLIAVVSCVVQSAVAQKYQVGPGEYNCLILNTSTHQVYTTLPGVPQQVTGIPSNIKYVMCGAHHWFVVDGSGNVFTWGTNVNGECGVGTITPTVDNPTQIMVDANGNPFNNVVQVLGGGAAGGTGWSSAALKADGTVWVWGNTVTGMRGNGTYGGNDPAPVQVQFPAGVVIKKIQFFYIGVALDQNGNVWTWGGSGLYQSPWTLGQGSANPDYNTPHMISLPAPAKDIAGSYWWNYALLTNGQLWGWGFFYPYLGIGNGGMAGNGNQSYSPVQLDAQLNLPKPISKIYTNNCGTYAILSDSTLWAWGDNATGAMGIGSEINYATYTSGGSPRPYAWDWGLGEDLVQKPVQVGPGLHSFTDVWVSSALVFYVYAEDANGQLYGWGRNKGAVIANGVVASDGYLGALPGNYPNSWDVPWITAINPFSQTAPIPSTSPYCYTNPGATGCSIGTEAPPNVSAGPNQTIATSTTTLQGTATGNGGTSPVYTIWSQVSGPNNPLIIIPSGLKAQVTGMVTGTYVFKLTVTDSYWKVNTSTVTITVNGAATAPTVNAGPAQTITLPTSTVNLSGSAQGVNGATISSTSWSELSGPGTATITSAGNLATAINGLAAGTYVFQLSATDNNGVTGTSSVTITVNAAAMPPTVNAGSAQTITMPTSTANLTGTATGNSGATISNTSWTEVSGPNTAAIGTASNLSTTVSGLAAGSYVFQLSATDNNGKSSTSTVTVTVKAALVPPSVNAGGAQTIALPTSTATLTGTATGNGGATISSTAWTQVSGPGTATIGSATNLSTTVSALVQGVYTFQFSATDNNGQTASTTVTVTVNAASVPPTVNAGTAQTITLPISKATLTGTATGNGGATISSTNWAQVSGPGTATIGSASSLSTTVSALVQGVYTFQLSATDNNGNTTTSTVTVTVNAASVPPTVSAGSAQTITLPTNSVTLAGTATAGAGWNIASTTWSQVSGPNTAAIASAASLKTLVTGLIQGSYVFQLSATDNNGQLGIATVTITVNPGSATNVPPTVSAGGDVTIQLPTNSTTLAGSAVGNGGATIASTVWTQQSGPNTASISGGNSLTPTVSGLAAGTYVFTLTVTDNNGLTTADNVNVIVKTANVAPTVNAGANQTIQLPTSTVTLSGSASGNGGATISSTQWTQVSGPATANIAGASTLVLTVTALTTPGTYVFQLAATDNNGLTASSTVSVIVSAANVAPTVSAGSGQTITLPASTVTLNGSAAGNGGATIVSTVWTQVSGPATANIAGASTLTLTVTALTTVGNYVFQLKATDNDGLTATASVTVVVKGAKQPPNVNAGNNKKIKLPQNSTSLSGTATGNGGANIVSTTWTQVSGPATATIGNASTLTPSVAGLAVAGDYVFQLTGTDDGGMTATSTTTVSVAAAPAPPTVSAGSNIYIQLPVSTANLSGTVTPAPGTTIVSTTWTEPSGALVATIAGGSTLTPTVSGLTQPGVYTFQLVATDNNGNAGTATVTVQALAPPPNKPPVANAGPDQTISLPTSTVTLDGTKSYDPDGTIAGYSWYQLSGKGGVTITNSNSATPQVVGLQAGTYTFVLVVTDNDGATAQAQVTITVDASSGGNPSNPLSHLVANAGKDTTILLPNQTVVLNGSASTDSGATIVAYSWKQVSGVSTAISTPDEVVTNASGLIGGTYVYRLTVQDNLGDTASATVTVHVQSNTRTSSVSADQIFIYPNPAHDIATLQISSKGDGTATMNIFGLRGGLVHQQQITLQEGTTTVPVNVSKFASGVYFVHIIMADGTIINGRLVKQ
jgi:hypothetical protein